MCTARVFVHGLCIVAQAAAPLCVGFSRCGRGPRSCWWCGCGGRSFLFGLGALCGVAPPLFRVWRRCGCWAMCFWLRDGVAAQPCFSLVCTWTSDNAVPGAGRKKFLTRAIDCLGHARCAFVGIVVATPVASNLAISRSTASRKTAPQPCEACATRTDRRQVTESVVALAVILKISRYRKVNQPLIFA